MRRVLVLALLLALLPPPAAADHGGIHISEILPDPGADGREFVELWNAGTASLDLAGWTVSDAAGNAFTFPAWELAAGGRVVVWSGGASDSVGPAWSMSAVWNNAGDQVLLHDAAGALVDQLAYGDASWPDGRTDPVPSAPATGSSLALYEGGWIESSPTPGSVATEQGGSMSATVQDVPPTALFTSSPGTVEPGASFTVSFTVDDDNGAADVASWTLTGDGVLLGDGTAAGAYDVALSAPTDRDRWSLVVEATDAAGQTGSDTVDVLIQSAGLVVSVPAGGITFPAFPPGAAEVLSEVSFTMRNDGSSTVTPRIDVSDLTGPATIALVGHLDIGYGTASTTWTAYDGALTTLPSLAPGESVEVVLRLHSLPTPLPAGAYGTSFTVVA